MSLALPCHLDVSRNKDLGSGEDVRWGRDCVLMVCGVDTGPIRARRGGSWGITRRSLRRCTSSLSSSSLAPTHPHLSHTHTSNTLLPSLTLTLLVPLPVHRRSPVTCRSRIHTQIAGAARPRNAAEASPPTRTLAPSYTRTVHGCPPGSHRVVNL